MVDELSRMVFCILVRGGVGASAYLRRLFENAVTVVTAVTTFGWHPLLFWVAIYMSSHCPYVCMTIVGGDPLGLVTAVTTETASAELIAQP